jgi:hypothetical protein
VLVVAIRNQSLSRREGGARGSQRPFGWRPLALRRWAPKRNRVGLVSVQSQGLREVGELPRPRLDFVQVVDSDTGAGEPMPRAAPADASWERHRNE